MEGVTQYAQVVAGNIDPAWLLNGITIIAVSLFWSQLRDIKTSMKEINALVQIHDKEIAVLKEQRRLDDEEFVQRIVQEIQAKVRFIVGNERQSQ